MFKPGVGDLGTVQVQRLEFGQPFEMHQPGVAYLGLTPGSAFGVPSIL